MVAVVLGRCTLFLRETIFPLLIYSNFKSNYLIVNHPLVFTSKLQRHLLGDSDDHIQHKVLKTIFKIGYFIHDIQHCFAPRDLKPESIPQWVVLSRRGAFCTICRSSRPRGLQTHSIAPGGKSCKNARKFVFCLVGLLVHDHLLLRTSQPFCDRDFPRPVVSEGGGEKVN